MDSINILLIIWAAVVLIPVFMLLPYISKQKEPFGYKAKEPVDDTQFQVIRNQTLPRGACLSWISTAPC